MTLTFSKTLVAAALLAATATTASAQDTNWTGFYGGLSFSIGDLEVDSGPVSDDFNALGLHAGYYHDMGDFVIGAELEHAKADFGFGFTGGGGGEITRLKLKGGYDLGRVLPYVTVGTSRLSVAGMSDSLTSFGVGMDYQLSDTVRLGAEYMMDRSNDTFSVTGSEIDLSSVNVRLSIGF